MKDKLDKLGLNPKNSVVIGSGILQALKIRNSNDIDIVASKNAYDRLKESGKFSAHLSKRKKEILKNDLFEIGTSWDVLGKRYELNDFNNDSEIIEGVRYITLDFLYGVKENWLKEGTARPKDITDLKLIKKYKKQ